MKFIVSPKTIAGIGLVRELLLLILVMRYYRIVTMFEVSEGLIMDYKGDFSMKSASSVYLLKGGLSFSIKKHTFLKYTSAPCSLLTLTK
jgi:hypothetical protein